MTLLVINTDGIIDARMKHGGNVHIRVKRRENFKIINWGDLLLELLNNNQMSKNQIMFLKQLLINQNIPG